MGSIEVEIHDALLAVSLWRLDHIAQIGLTTSFYLNPSKCNSHGWVLYFLSK